LKLKRKGQEIQKQAMFLSVHFSFVSFPIIYTSTMLGRTQQTCRYSLLTLVF